MRKKWFKLLLVLALCISPLLGMVANVQAQESVSTPTPAPALQGSTGTGSESNIVTFEQLQQEEIQLTGPYDATSFSFAIPAAWVLLPGTQLNLSMGVAFDSTVLTQFDYPVAIGGGTLSVFLNGKLIEVLALNEAGELEQNIQISLEDFISDRLDERIEVRFILDSGDFCYISEQFNLVIHKNSHFVLPHEPTQPGTDLVKFPLPIYQDTFIEDSALVIIPNQPSAAELQSALTVAAGLGNLSQNNVSLDLSTLGNLSPDLVSNRHLIFIGKVSSLPTLNELGLPLPVSDSKFQTADGNPDDGVVQMIVSPWSNAHALLVVSGNTDLGTIKAAQAVSTGFLRPNQFENLAIVQEVQPTAVTPLGTIDQTLADLGYQDRVFDSGGSNYTNYSFYIPPGLKTSSDAYFELIFAHSAILNYDRSVVTILLNSRPIGSVRMDDTSAGKATNHVKVEIPAAAVRPGRNNLSLRIELIATDICSPKNAAGLWFRIWPESILHLPLEQAFFSPVSDLDLAAFPAPFSDDPALSNTAFLLSRNDLDSWQSAIQIAAYLGDQAGGSITTLSVFYGDEFPADDRAKYNILLIGRPTQLPIINEVNDALPAPFSQGNDVATEANFQVTYRIPPDSPLGYVELITSPWNTDNVLLAILGNTTQGVNWASLSLIDTQISWRLAGNFAVVNDQQVLTTDTRSTASVSNEISIPVQEAITPPSAVPPPAPVARPNWILPVLILTFAVIIFIIAFVIIGNWKRNRAIRKSEKEL